MNKNALVIFLLETHANEWGIISSKDMSEFAVYEKETARLLGKGKKLVDAVLAAKRKLEYDLFVDTKKKKIVPVSNEEKAKIVKSFFGR